MKIHYILLALILLLLTSCNSADEDSIRLPCYSVDTLNTRPLREDIFYTISEQVSKSEYITIIKIENYIEQIAEDIQTPKTTFKVETILDIKGIFNDESYELSANLYCYYNELIDDYSINGHYGNSNPDDFYQNGKYYLVFSNSENDIEKRTLWWIELENYDSSKSFSLQTKEIVDIIIIYINGYNEQK